MIVQRNLLICRFFDYKEKKKERAKGKKDRDRKKERNCSRAVSGRYKSLKDRQIRAKKFSRDEEPRVCLKEFTA